MTIAQMITYYRVYVPPCFQYGIFRHGAVRKSSLDCAQKLQKRFFRIIFRKSYRHSISDEIVKKIATFYELHIYELLKKIVNEDSMRKCKTSFYSTRSSAKIVCILPAMRGKFEFFPRVIKLMNVLSNWSLVIQTFFEIKLCQKCILPFNTRFVYYR